MQPTSTTTTRTPVPTRKTHPIRGILWGIVIGLGATVLAILLKIIPLDIVWAAIVLAGGIVIGTLWSTLGPASKPKGAPPWRQTEVTQRPDWDAAPVAPVAPVPPVPPDPPGTEPLLIKPLDVEPVDIEALDTESPAVSDIPTSDAPVWDGPSERLSDPVQPVVDPDPDQPRAMDPPQTMDQPRRMDPPRTMAPPPPPSPPPPLPPPAPG